MYWDVVEVRPEPDYWVFVRFKDGLSGRVRLDPEELAGVLAPLREVQFFNQVYVDCGAVAWPGDFDLAPERPRIAALSATDRSSARDRDTALLP
jgi:hypothetical protein